MAGSGNGAVEPNITSTEAPIDLTSTDTLTTFWDDNVTASSLSTVTNLTTAGPEGMDCSGLKFLGECVSSVQEYFSFITGVMAVLLWLWANYQFLQARKKQGEAATGQAIYVIHLLLADSLNLLGAILCDQLGTQILTASILVLCDVIFVFLLTCTWRRQRTAQQLNNNWNAKNAAKTQNGSILPVCCLLLPWMVGLATRPIGSLRSESGLYGAEGRPMIGRKLLMVTDSGVDNFGFALGIIAALLYSTVRLTTIKDSFYRKSVVRQEMGFHIIATLASLVYCSSVVIYSIDSPYIINALPWLCGQAILGLQDLFIVFMTWRFSPPKLRMSWVDDDTMLLGGGGDASSINHETEERPMSAPQGASVVPERRSPFLKTKPYLEIVEKSRSDTMQTDVSYLGEERTSGHMIDSANQREVRAQVISQPLYQTDGPEEDLFMNRQNLRPPKKPDYEDDFEVKTRTYLRSYDKTKCHKWTCFYYQWDFSDINRQYGKGQKDGKWVRTDDWDEERVLKEIEDELKKTDSDEDERASTPSLSYDGQSGSQEDLTN